MDELLQQGIAAARAGRREEARGLLMRVVEADERNERAWLWLAGVVDDPGDIRTCLENVLDLNPDNVKAQQGLAWVNQRYGPPAAEYAVPGGEIAQATVALRSEPALAQEPQNSPYTGPTTRLAEAEPIAPPDARPVQPPQPPPPMPAAPAHPCPYCGAPTALEQRRCTQCRGSLMTRAEPRAKRSAALTVLAVFWGISAGFSILGALLSALGGLLVFQGIQNIARQTNPRASVPFPIELLMPAIILLIMGGLAFAVMRGLLHRQRWAYYIAVVSTVLGVFATVSNVVEGALVLRNLPQQLRESMPPGAASVPPGVVSLIGSLIGVILIVVVAFMLLDIALVWFSYHDFFSPMARLLPEVGHVSHTEHYNNGVAYKNRGMWYMATKEWEAAVRMAPRDLNYLHALGLAYAQIRRFDQARATLDTALRIAPNHEQLMQSRALLDQMAGRKG